MRAYAAEIATSLCLCILVATAATGTPSETTPRPWISIGPPGGFVEHLVIDDRDSEIVYATTPVGAFKSVDGGESWQQLSALDGSVHWIEIDPATSSTVYASTLNSDGAFMFKSENGGTTWDVFGESLDCPAVVEQLLVVPANPSLMYAIACSTVFRSRNAGQTWELADQGIPPGADVGVLAVDPANEGLVFAGTHINFSSEPRSYGLFVSADAGDTWTASNEGLPDDIGIYALAVATDASKAIYAAVGQVTAQNAVAGRGVFKSVDGGQIWHRTNTGDYYIVQLVLDPLDSRRVYASSGGSLILRTDDGGDSWTLIPGTGSSQWIAPDPTVSGRVLVAGSGGIFRSDDHGLDWYSLNRGFNTHSIVRLQIEPGNSEVLYAQSSSQHWWRSEDRGQTWSAIEPRSRDLLIDPKEPSTLYASYYPGMLKSDDRGSTWEPAFGNRPPDGFVTALAIDPTKPSTLYLGVSSFHEPIKGAVFKSVDAGRSWSTASTGLDLAAVYRLAIDPFSPSTIVAADLSEALFVSVDAGITWRPIEGKPFERFFYLMIAPTSPPTLHVTSNTGNYRSSDLGQSWTKFDEVGPSNAASLAFDPADPRILFAATLDGSIRQSIDSGDHWCTTPLAPLAGTVQSLTVDPNDRRYLYAGTGRASAYRVRLRDELAGDCDDDGTVTISELTITVRIALGISPLIDCEAADRHNDGTVSIADLVGAVRVALGFLPSLC